MLLKAMLLRAIPDSPRGEIEKHKYRRALARDGYALVKCDLAVFKPEA